MDLHAPKNIQAEKWFIECYRKYRGHPLKILVGLYKGNYNKFLLAALFGFVKHSPVWVLPIITANIINDIIGFTPDTAKHMVGQAVFLTLLTLCNIPLAYFYTRYKSLATRYVETGLRKALIAKLQQLSIAYHTETQSGRLQSKIMRDVEAVETLSTQMFLNILSIAMNTGVALIITVAKSRIIFLFFLLTTPVAAMTMMFFRNIMRTRNKEFRHEMEETSARVMEMVELIPVTRAHALEEEEIGKMSRQLMMVAEKGYKLDVIQALFGAVGWVAFQIFQVVCLVFTGFLALKGEILAGDITLYQNYFSTIVSQVSALLALVPTLAKGMESVNSIGEVILEEDVEKNEGKKQLTEVKGEFDFQNVSFQYKENEKRVLDQFDFHVNPGETIAFVGESGAGKSTILNLVIGFGFATEGSVLVDGEDIRKIDLRSYRKYLAVVPQTSILFSGSIRDNILYGMENVDDKVLDEVIQAANLSDLIDSLPDGVDTMVGEHGGKLSGGQRQRISIARALIRNPRVIVLDEATSALDSISEKMIQKALKNLTAGRTTFIVAHRLSTIRDADKIAVIADGKCVEYGSYEELMEAKGRFYQMKVIQS